mgnify:CR=1 FL=1
MFGILAYSFNIINLNFILSNIILIPIFEIITIIGIVNILGIGLLICIGLKPEVVLSYWIIERILRYMYMIIDLMLELIIITTKILSDFKFNIYITNFNIIVYVIYYLIICLLILYIVYKEKSIQRLKTDYRLKYIVTSMIITIILMILVLIGNIYYNMISRKNMLYFVDIGQGDSSVIQTKDRKKYSYRYRRR